MDTGALALSIAFAHWPVFFVPATAPVGIKLPQTGECSAINNEHHRPPRHSFTAIVEITDLQSETQLTAHLKDISLFGCFVETPNPLPEGTKVRLRIVRGGATVAATGRVAFSRPSAGMGIHFTNVEPASMPVLDKWVANLRE